MKVTAEFVDGGSKARGSMKIERCNNAGFLKSEGFKTSGNMHFYDSDKNFFLARHLPNVMNFIEEFLGF